MNLNKIFQLGVYILYKIGYFGKINFLNLDVLKNYRGPGIIIANHQYKIDLFIPIILNFVLNRDVHALAAAYAFQNKIKSFIGERLNLIFVTKSLSRDELVYISNKANIVPSEKEIEEAYHYYFDLSIRFNKKAHERIREILSDNGLVFIFAQAYPSFFFEMERASEGIGRHICKYPDVPVFPVSIVDKSKSPVETCSRNNMTDLRRIDLLMDKRRQHFAGVVDVSFKEPIVLNKRSLNSNSCGEIADEVMTYISSDIPAPLRGYYKDSQFSGRLNFFSFWKNSP